MFNIFETNIVDNSKNGTITLTNIPSKQILRDLSKVWATSTVSTYMFKKMTRTSLELHYFFIPDFYYSLNKIKQYNNKYTSTTSINLILELLKTKTWFSAQFKTFPHKLDYTQLSHLKYTLLPKQIESLEMYDTKTQSMQLNGFLLSAIMGSGKSLMSIAVSTCLKSEVTIIICPKSIVHTVWENEINTQFNNTKKIWFSTLNDEMTHGFDYYVVHYESIYKAIDYYLKHTGSSKPVIILDESHNLNDLKAQRTNQYIQMCKLSGSVNILHASGTPIKALGSECIPLLTVIDPKFTDEVKVRFSNIYNRSASRALEILNHRLSLISHRIEKQDVMGNIPEPIREEVLIKIPDTRPYELTTIQHSFQRFLLDRTKYYERDSVKHEEVYFKCVNNYKSTIRTKQEQIEFDTYMSYIKIIKDGYNPTTMGEYSIYCNKFEREKISPIISDVTLKRQFQESKTIYKYLRLKIMGEFLGGVLNRLRVSLTNELIEHSNLDVLIRNSEKQTICFTDYVPSVLYADAYLRKRGFKPILIYGDTNKDIIQHVNEFKNNKTSNPLIATIKSLSTGVTLTNANTCVFFNQPFRHTDYQQASNRIYRIGQDTQVYFFDFILDCLNPTLGSRMKDIQLWSKDQIDKILLDQTVDISLEGFIERFNEKEISVLDW